MIRPEMYIVCGQCGTLNAVKGPIEPNTARARCSHCKHEIPLALHLQGADVDRKTLFPRSEVGFARLARKALRERIMVVCDSCDSRMKVGKRLAGKTVKCPSCSAEISVPYLDEEDKFDFSLLVAAARKEHDDRDEVVEMAASDYEKVGEDVLLGRGVFKITRTRLVVFVTLYLVIMVLVLAGGIIFKGLRDEPPAPTGPAANPTPAALPSEPVVEPDAPAPTVEPSVMLGEIRWDAFASGGYRPARPGRLYCKISVTFDGGTAGLELPNAGRAIILELSEQRYPSLGEPIEKPRVPVIAARRILRIEPGRQQDVTFLFECPPGGGAGLLQIDGLRDLVLTVPAPPETPASFVGSWSEALPRNLKPLLTDPVMARLQQTPEQNLHIREQGGKLLVDIPHARVAGAFDAPTTGRQTQGTLHYREHSLPCLVRLAPDGQTLLLYLSDAPMHQLTYRRTPADEPQAQANPDEQTP